MGKACQDFLFQMNELLGASPREKALITMWERRAELEGLAAVMEGVRQQAARTQGFPALVERAVQRAKNFFEDFNTRLQEVPFIAGKRYSAADITTLVAVDFAKALEPGVPPQHAALKRWYETVSGRPSAAA